MKPFALMRMSSNAAKGSGFKMLLTHLKHMLNLARLRVRGLYGAKDEFNLAAIANNLRKLAQHFPNAA